MQNSVFRLGVAFLVSYIMISCAASHSGNMLNSASLSTDNFYYVKTNVFASAECTYFLGLGGYAHEALVGEAKQNLYLKSGLENNQAYANITVNWKTQVTFLGFIVRRVCTVSADIVEFHSGQGLISENSIVTEPESLSSGKSIVAESARSFTSKSQSYQYRAGSMNAVAERILRIAKTPKDVFKLTEKEQKKFVRSFKYYLKEYDQISVYKDFDKNDLLIKGSELDDFTEVYIELK
jgi:hypothetical protein